MAYRRLIDAATNLLSHASRPLAILGYDVRLAGATEEASHFIQKHRIPFVTTWSGIDLLGTEHSLNLGVIGMSGQKGANRAVFDADLLLCIGTHLAIPHTTTLFEDFAPQSKKIIVDIDKDQLEDLNVDFDLKIRGDAAEFLSEVTATEWSKPTGLEPSLYRNQNWYEPELVENHPNSNKFVRLITRDAPGRVCVIVDGGRTAMYAAFQSAIIERGSRIVCSSSMSSMGTGLAETIGAASSGLFDTYICVIGDGSFLMNVQDLQTIAQYRINGIICVINNNGYLAIRHTQREFLDSKFHGTHPKWGLTLPETRKIAAAFDIPYVLLDAANKMEEVIQDILKLSGPRIVELMVAENQPVLFRQAFQAKQDGSFEPQPLSTMLP